MCHKTADEPRVYRNAVPTRTGYEVTSDDGGKVKYRREEVAVFDNATDALEWFYAALDERCETLENRICHIRKEASIELSRLQQEEWEAL